MAKKKNISESSIDSVIEDLKKLGVNKQFRIGSQYEKVETIPTAYRQLNEAIGIIGPDGTTNSGGIPRGKLIEIFGPEGGGKSNIGLGVIANAQKMGYMCALIDVESSFNEERATQLGVDVDSLLVGSGFDNGEHALATMEKIILSKRFAVVVLDSTAALIPKAELEGEIGDHHMALLARLLSQGVKKIVDACDKTKTAAIFINQVREKPGVQYGCFHEDTPVMFADGSQHSIKEVVDNNLVGPVLSWDGENIVERNIVDWHYNDKLKDDEEWLTFRTTCTGGRRGAMGFTCTPNHILVLEDGKEISADKVKIGDKILSWYESSLTQGEREIIEGSLLGDGHIALTYGEEGTALLQLANSEQPEYLKWKMNQIKSLGFSKNESCGRTAYRSNTSFELGFFKQSFYNNGKGYRTIDPDFVRNCSYLTLAVWYMDDGCYKESHRNASISIKRLDHQLGYQVAEALNDRIGVGNISYMKSERSIAINTQAFREFCGKVAEFIHSSMRYKLIPEMRGDYDNFELREESTIKRIPIGVEVIGIHKSERKMRSKHKYDISVEGNSFYLVGGDSRGVVVHNSPEMTPGGKALKFYSSLRIRVAFRGTSNLIYKDGELIGGMSAAKIVKNRFAAPHKDCEFPIYYTDYVPGASDEIYDIARKAEYADMPENTEKKLKGKIIKKIKDRYRFEDTIVEGEQHFKDELVESGIIHKVYETLMNNGATDKFPELTELGERLQEEMAELEMAAEE